MICFGRNVIYTSYTGVTRENLPDILSLAFPLFAQNRADSDELYKRYRGDQPILKREKEVRPTIKHNTVVNYANEIVSFKTAYFLSEPLQYVSAGDNSDDNENGVPDIVDRLNRLNNYMRAENKPTRDKELVDWANICGTSYRLVLPNSYRADDYDSPFSIYTLDPRWTFVVYHGGVGHRPVLAAVVVPKDNDEGCVLSCYARLETGQIVFFELDYPSLPFSTTQGGNTPVWTGYENPNTPVFRALDLPDIPIIEYPANMARLGSFEVVLGQIDEINLLSSNQAESVDQNVQALWVFQNCQIDEKALEEASGGSKAIMVKSEGSAGQESKVYAVTVNQDLNGIQSTINGARDAMLSICGMPATSNGRASTSDTGSAVIMRDGWQMAESRAKDLETIFRDSESRFLRIVLYITRNTTDLDLNVHQIEMKFNRRNYADLLTRVQALTTMLNTPQLAPQLAFEHCGLFTDPEAAYAVSMAYYAEMQRKAEAEAEQAAADENAETGESSQAPEESVPETQQEASA